MDNTAMDTLLNLTDRALRTLFAPHHAARPLPGASQAAPELTTEEKTLSGALMRVNHVGEVCAQALYTGQALATQNLRSKPNCWKPAPRKPTIWPGQRLDSRPWALAPACSTPFGTPGLLPLAGGLQS